MSIVTAVYNVGQFLREAIDSVIEQDIGFEHIQLILVDDGSTDNSGVICDEYQAKYPDNIVVIHKENAGVSAARNDGLKRVEGKYTNFMDADDKLARNAVRIVCDFFSQHENETDVVALPVYFFDGKKGPHPLNHKFKKGSRVIALDREYRNPHLQIASTFICSECMQKHWFDPRLAFAEDAQVLLQVLLHKCTMGVVQNTKYYYRRRSEGELSAIQSGEMRSVRYLPYMHFFQQETICYCMKNWGYIPRFVQYTLMYDLQWRIKQQLIPEGVLSEAERTQYITAIQQVLRHIDDTIIMEQPKLYREQKFHALRLKYGDVPAPIRGDSDVVFAFPKGQVFKVSQFQIRFDFLNLDDNTAQIEGTLLAFVYPWENFEIYIRANGQLYLCTITETTDHSISLGETIQIEYCFKGSIPMSDEGIKDIDIVLYVQDVYVPVQNIVYRQFFPVSSKYKKSYARRGKWIVTKSSGGVRFQIADDTSVRTHEKAFWKELWNLKTTNARKTIAIRFLVSIIRKLKHRPLWLISDRAAKAGDNGEAMFRYICENHRKDVKCYFVIRKDCPDYKRMKDIGPVLVKDSIVHKILLLASNCILSSQGELDIYNPFKNHSEAYRDILASTKFVFLQHGITKDDISGWLKKRNKNLKGFVTAARPEYQSILDGSYGYTEQEVWATGFPRFDRLYQSNEKLITVMPTWRRYHMGEMNLATGKWSLLPGFEQTQYFQFYNQLINNPRLIQAAKKNGYTLAFFPHPILQSYIERFSHNPGWLFLDIDTEYRDTYARSSLMLTDYSSAVFDFAYMRKPVIYTQFDSEEFFSGKHNYTKGYFDYERDGFGEVEYDLESTVNRIIEYMENGCQLKDKYRERIDNFFMFNDRNNCQRVYEKIMELDTKEL